MKSDCSLLWLIQKVKRHRKSKHVETLPWNPVQPLIQNFNSFFVKESVTFHHFTAPKSPRKMIVQNDAQSLTKVIISKMNLQRIMQTLGGAAVWPKCFFNLQRLLHILHPAGALYTWGARVFVLSERFLLPLVPKCKKSPSDSCPILKPVVC